MKSQTVYWKGLSINRHSDAFQSLVLDAFKAMFRQCPKFSDALAATGNKILFHTMGKQDPHQAILTEKEFCDILTELRKEL